MRADHTINTQPPVTAGKHPDGVDPVGRGQSHQRDPRAECLQPPTQPPQLSAMTQNNGEVEAGHEIGIRPGVLFDFPHPDRSQSDNATDSLLGSVDPTASAMGIIGHRSEQRVNSTHRPFSQEIYAGFLGRRRATRSPVFFVLALLCFRQ